MGEVMKRINPKYVARKARQKGKEGSIEGALATIIGLLIMALVKHLLGDVPDGMENTIAVASGTIAGSIIIGIKRWIGNRGKHKYTK